MEYYFKEQMIVVSSFVVISHNWQFICILCNTVLYALLAQPVLTDSSVCNAFFAIIHRILALLQYNFLEHSILKGIPYIEFTGY